MINYKKILINSIVMLIIQTATLSNAIAQTSFFRAAYYGHSHEVSAAINNGEDVNLIDNNGWTALMYAANMSKTETVKILIENGADVNFRDRDGWTPLISAESLEVIKILVANGADVNARAHDGWTALDYAVWEENQVLIDYLLAVGANKLTTIQN
ncbi:MAG: ankyrin repeat domain-containing protein [Bacteroidia bacterium]|nr:ankyrin repeat domain-containing protein [Bacteroidia bacterium]